MVPGGIIRAAVSWCQSQRIDMSGLMEEETKATVVVCFFCKAGGLKVSPETTNNHEYENLWI